jgi:hypothetical protein
LSGNVLPAVAISVARDFCEAASLDILIALP